MKRHGAVLVFKKGAKPDRIAKAIGKLAAEGIIDLDYYLNGAPQALIREFDDKDGGPVWYVP
jgi:hypothetical protein